MSDLRLPVEVDDYSDSRWSRIERDVFSELEVTALPQRRIRFGGEHRQGWAWATALVAAAALAIVVARPWASMHSGDRLQLATTDSVSQFTVGDSSLTVAPQSLVIVGGDDEHGINVVLDRGTVTCEVAPRNGRPPFVVEAGDVRVRVVGTRFTVARGPTGTLVDVERGVVEVASRGVVDTVREGQHWPTRSGGAKPANADTASTQADTMNPAPAPSAPPLMSRPNGASRPRAGAGASASSATTQLQPWPEDDDKTTPAQQAVTPQADLSASSPQRLFESAALIERTRPDDAAAVYRRLAAGGSAWAPNALFALARLEADRRHHDQAVGLLNEYLSRYPHGLNSDDARSLLQRMR